METIVRFGGGGRSGFGLTASSSADITSSIFLYLNCNFVSFERYLQE
jgi:hypothetical protein